MEADAPVQNELQLGIDNLSKALTALKESEPNAKLSRPLGSLAPMGELDGNRQ